MKPSKRVAHPENEFPRFDIGIGLYSAQGADCEQPSEGNGPVMNKMESAESVYT